MGEAWGREASGEVTRPERGGSWGGWRIHHKERSQGHKKGGSLLSGAGRMKHTAGPWKALNRDRWAGREELSVRQLRGRGTMASRGETSARSGSWVWGSGDYQMPIWHHHGAGGRWGHRSGGGSPGGSAMKCERKGRVGMESWETLALQGGGGPKPPEGLKDVHASVCSFTPQTCKEHLINARRCARLWALSSEQSRCDPCCLGAYRPTEGLCECVARSAKRQNQSRVEGIQSDRGRVSVLNGVDRESLSREVTFKQRPKGGWVSHVGSWDWGCSRD